MARPPALAHKRFQEHERRLQPLGLKERFAYIYESNLWGGESRSGLGSALEETGRLRAALPALIANLGAQRLLDIPCGDFGWLSRIALEAEYIGADIVEELVAHNNALYAGPRRSFVALDLTRDALPAADVVLCRDCLVHLSFANIFHAFANLKRSGSTYLLATTFLDHNRNEDIGDGDWRPLNLERAPFRLPRPEAVIVEGCTECGGAYRDKALGMWRTADLPAKTDTHVL